MKKLSTLIISLILLLPLASFAAEKQATAVFAGGCFWCMQEAFDKVPGVIKTEVGYTGGSVKHPSYQQVSSGKTGHVEAIQVTYNPAKLSYPELLTAFWHNVDPVDAGGQFCDRGVEYRSVIFYDSSQQQAAAEKSKTSLIKSGKFKQIATEILPEKKFYAAETYHQNYYKKNPIRYKFYKYNCGRAKRLEQIWGK